MESHPNVTIEMTDLGSTDYMTQLATQLAGGNGELDVLSIKDIPGYSNLINLGMLEPLSGKLTTDESKFNGRSGAADCPGRQLLRCPVPL